MLKLVYRAILPALLAVALTPYTHACSKPPGFGFILRTQFEDTSVPFPVATNQPHQTVSGTFNTALSNTLGDRTSFQGTSDGSAALSELGKATPATWDITFLNGHCSIQDPFSFGLHTRTILFVPNSSPQPAICNEQANGVGFSANPGTADVSVQNQWTITMTTQSSPWSYTPVTYVNFDGNGNVLSQGSVTYIDQYNCSATFIAVYTGGPQYLWLAESSGMGIGYTNFSVTNGSSGGGM